MLHMLMLDNADIVKQKQKRNNPIQRQSLLASWCTFFFFSSTNFISVIEGKLEKSPSLFQTKMSHINDFELLVKYLEHILEQMFYFIWVNLISKRG